MFVLPSIYKSEIPYARMSLADWYFIVTIYLMPTCFIGFLPSQLVYVPGLFDYRLLTFLLALPLPFIGPRHEKNVFWEIPGIKILTLLALSVIMRAVWSNLKGVALFEIIAVLRWNMIWPIYTILVLHFASRLPYQRLYAILRIFLILFSIHIILASVSVLTNIDFFLNKISLEKSLQYIERGLPVDNLRAFPMHIFTGTAFLMILFLRSHGKQIQEMLFMVAVALPFLFTRRMYSIIVLFQSAAIYFISLLGRANRMVFRVPILLLSIFLIIYAIQPERLNVWFEKMMPAFEQGIDPDNVGTYIFRKSLLADSMQSIAENNSLFWGMGYEREYNILRERGYAYTLGEDAPIASVIFCEGWGGLILRVLPYLFLFWFNFKRLMQSNEQNIKLYAAAATGVIIAQVPAYLQTASVTHFEYFYVPLAMVELIILKLKNIGN